MDAEPMNWIATISGTIAAFLLGWAIYSPMLFGKGWAEGSGVSLDAAKSMSVLAMLTQLIALFLLAIVIGRTAMISDLWTALAAIFAAAGFAVSGGKFAGKSTYALTVDGGYIIAAGAVMILAQGLL